MVGLGEAVEFRVGICRVAVAVECADEARFVRDGWLSRRMVGPIGAALALCASILGVGAWVMPPMVSFCDDECEIKEQARDILPYLAIAPVVTAAEKFDPRPVARGDGLVPEDERDEYCDWVCRHGDRWGTTSPWASQPWAELLPVDSDSCGLEPQACCSCEAAAIEVGAALSSAAAWPSASR